jgi:hypothetical protein
MVSKEASMSEDRDKLSQTDELENDDNDVEAHKLGDGNNVLSDDGEKNVLSEDEKNVLSEDA